MRITGKVAEPGKEEWLPLSIRSFICSHGSTLSVIWAPAISRRAARHEVILNHPLNKWLTADGARIFYAECGADFSQRLIGGGGHDTVNHGAGKTDVFSDPLRQFGGALFRHAQNRIFNHVTVIRNIIAGEYRKRRQASFAAAGQGFTRIPGTDCGSVGLSRS
jgi:hypothetical protein